MSNKKNPPFIFLFFKLSLFLASFMTVEGLGLARLNLVNETVEYSR